MAQQLRSANLAAPPTPAPDRERSAVSPPDSFDGNRANGRRFLRQCWLYIESRPRQFPDARARILFVLSYMKSGAAATWAGTVTQALMDNKSSYSAFADFLSDFALNFVLSDEKGDAANRIDGMEQGSHSIEDFI
ncbi:hypothetical protein AURDEDRAFT_62339, partial [Auricularia subglabra TFB-10046 SS5]